MAFIRRRGNCTTLIETYRVGNQVKQRVIANLYGESTALEAIPQVDCRIDKLEQWLNEEEIYFGALIKYKKGPNKKERRRYMRRSERLSQLREERERLLKFSSSLPTS